MAIGERYEGIVSAACGVIARRGFHQASTREIARAAGLSLAGLYHYVGEKDELLFLVLDRSLDRLIADLDRNLAEARTPEDRLLALLILIRQYYRDGQAVRDKIHRFYLENTRFINNWDLVDASAPHLVGHYLEDRPKDTLTRLAASGNLWERRLAANRRWFRLRSSQCDQLQ